MKTVEGGTCVWNVGAELGEGPVWHAAESALWFVDIKAPRIHRLSTETGVRRSWDVPDQIGFIMPTREGGWVAGLRTGPHHFNSESGTFHSLRVPERHPPQRRLNDAHVDALGRLWFGSMHDNETTRGGCLYRLDADGNSRVQDDGYVITNGPCTSPDGRILYHTDTADRVIYAFDVAANGTLSNKRVFVRITREGAYPDGPLVDAEGCVWTALFGGWGLERYSPKGELLQYLRLPVSNVTKAAFGGPELKTLYITTARLHLDQTQRKAQPLAGGLFRWDAPVAGLPQHEIAHGYKG